MAVKSFLFFRLLFLTNNLQNGEDPPNLLDLSGTQTPGPYKYSKETQFCIGHFPGKTEISYRKNSENSHGNTAEKPL